MENENEPVEIVQLTEEERIKWVDDRINAMKEAPNSVEGIAVELIAMLADDLLGMPIEDGDFGDRTEEARTVRAAAVEGLRKIVSDHIRANEEGSGHE